jgi:hypothetical protein
MRHDNDHDHDHDHDGEDTIPRGPVVARGRS